MDKHYSIKNAFSAAFNTLIGYKEEFFKLIIFDFLVIFQLILFPLLKTMPLAGMSGKIFIASLYILNIVFMLAGMAMFLQAYKRKQVSFVKGLNKVATAKMIGKFLLLVLIGISFSLVFCLPLVFVLSFIYMSIPMYATIINGILVTAALVVIFYFVGRSSLFATQALIDGNSSFEALKKSYSIASAKLLLTVVGFVFLWGGIAGLLAVPIVIVSSSALKVIAVFFMSCVTLAVRLLISGTLTHLYFQLKDQ